MPSQLSKKLKKAGVKVTQPPRVPLWQGPESNSPNGGCTQSLISRYLCCQARFQLYAIEGLRPADSFKHSLEYGNMWHVCEEAAAAEVRHFKGELKGTDTTLWEDNLKSYAAKLCEKYRMQQEQVAHWYNVCKTQFPIYIDYWRKHPDMEKRTPIAQELVFNVPYELPSGRTVYLRGKFDSIDLVGKGKNAEIWLQENKAKGDIDEEQIKRNLSFDLQTMVYLIALEWYRDNEQIFQGELNLSSNKIAGVRYNVIRRPLSGGKGSIRRHQPSKSNPQGESEEAFYKRLADDYISASPQEYFFRWNVEITQTDIKEFKRQFLNPALENLCDDYEWWNYCYQNNTDHFDYLKRECDFRNHRLRNWRLPFNVYNALMEIGSTEYDQYMKSGSTGGLERYTGSLFNELESEL